MDKAEELKQKFIRDWKPSHRKALTEHEYNDLVMIFKVHLEQYAQQASREVAIKFVKWLTQYGYNLTDHLGMYSIRFDEWYSKQL